MTYLKSVLDGKLALGGVRSGLGLDGHLLDGNVISSVRHLVSANRPVIHYCELQL